MNERIRELMDKAMVKTGDMSRRDDTELDPEKFAQLIIKECILMCETQEYHYWRSPEDQEFTPIDCADAIKEHFGVEE